MLKSKVLGFDNLPHTNKGAANNRFPGRVIGQPGRLWPDRPSTTDTWPLKEATSTSFMLSPLKSATNELDTTGDEPTSDCHTVSKLRWQSCALVGKKTVRQRAATCKFTLAKRILSQEDRVVVCLEDISTLEIATLVKGFELGINWALNTLMISWLGEDHWGQAVFICCCQLPPFFSTSETANFIVRGLSMEDAHKDPQAFQPG